jgi:hypothetical protein
LQGRATSRKAGSSAAALVSASNPAFMSPGLTLNPSLTSSAATTSCAARSRPTVLRSAISRSRKPNAVLAAASIAASTAAQSGKVETPIDASWYGA